MDDALKRALGELLLNSLPTIFMFAVLYLAYRFLVHVPLMKVLAERHSKTEGAIARAQADIAAADAKTADYEARMREARMAIFKSQEAQRKRFLESRSSTLTEVRASAERRVKDARAEIEKEAINAKGGLQAQSESLAAEIIRAVLSGEHLPKAGRPAPAAGGQQ